MKFIPKTKKISSGALLIVLLVSTSILSSQVYAAPPAPAKCFNQLAGTVYLCNGANTVPAGGGSFQEGNCYIYTSPQKGWIKQQDCSLSQFATIDGNTLKVVPVATDTAACGKSVKSCCKVTSTGATRDCGFIKQINTFISFLSVIVGIACAFGIIIGGIEYSMSGGDPKKAASGKDHITKAVIAVVLFGFLYTFLQFIVPGGFLNG